MWKKCRQVNSPAKNIVIEVTVYGLRFTVYGLRFTVYGLRFTVIGSRLKKTEGREELWGSLSKIKN